MLIAWTVLVVITTLLCYRRLSDSLLTKYSAVDSLNLILNLNDECLTLVSCQSFSGDRTPSAWRFDPTLMACRNSSNGCLRGFSTLADCERTCVNVYMAPIGAYLMLASFVISLCLVFSFVCLPFDHDKPRLRNRLFVWLIVDLVAIAFVLVLGVTGAGFIIFHDKDSSIVWSDRWYERLFSDALLVGTPFLVLGFHVYFWRSVCRLFHTIDTCKHLIKSKDTWSDKV